VQVKEATVTEVCFL